MALFKKKAAPEVMEPMDLDAVMKKYDRESNVRVWEGTPRLVVNLLLAMFSLFVIYVTLFTSWLEEIRLTSFMACIVFVGFLVFPAKKGTQKVNHMPWFDFVAIGLGTAAFLYFTFNAYGIIQQGSSFEWYQIAIGIVGILALAEVCRRSVGLPILIVAGCFVVYALIWGRRLNMLVRTIFYTKEGIFSTPVNVCSKFIGVFIIFGAFLERTGIGEPLERAAREQFQRNCMGHLLISSFAWMQMISAVIALCKGFWVLPIPYSGIEIDAGIK